MCCFKWNGWIIFELEICERKRSWPILRLYSRILLEELKSTKKPQSEVPVSRPRFEPYISRIGNWIVNHVIVMFGLHYD